MKPFGAFLSVFLLLALAPASALAATTTANMSLSVPAVGDTDYPTSFSSTFTAIDTHDHTSGKGVQIPAGGIATSAVTSAKILDGTIATVDLADGIITKPKLAALGQVVSSSSGTSGTQATSAHDFATRTFTSTGRPVHVVVQGTGGVALSRYFFSYVSGSKTHDIQLSRDSTVLAHFQIQNAGATSMPLGFEKVDAVAAGTYTYKLQGFVADAANTLFLDELEVMVFEL